MTAARSERAPRTDAELLRAVAAGEIDALAEIYNRHQEPLRHFIARATSRSTDVEDLVQTVFLEAARSAERYDGRAGCRPWLIGIAVHHLRRRGNAFGRLVRMLSSLGRTESVDPRLTLHARTDLERALASISHQKRITFLLAELEGMSGAEIAALTGVPIGTVWTRLHAARRELRAYLEAP